MRRRLDRSIRLLIALNIVAIGSLLGIVILDSIGSRPGVPAQLETLRPASFDLVEMGIAHIPTTASCLLCHESGGDSRVKAVPVMGHELKGWSRCLICHSDASLGKQAPGHEGIPETECTSCHREPVAGPPITQPHADLRTPCFECHGTVAHLPSSMVSREETECWLCHKPAASPPPEDPHPELAAPGCRSCHKSSDVGALPFDHALRGDDTCVLCHAVPGASPATGLRPPSVPLGRAGG